MAIILLSVYDSSHISQSYLGLILALRVCYVVCGCWETWGRALGW